jgi:DNA helicase II / ATP-dependent DNA helicase PcrA
MIKQMATPSGRIDFKAQLNDEQYAAVTAPRGPALVLAGAGSGKTRVLTYRVAWLCDQGVRHWQMLLLTFTNKAAREMLGRVETLTGETNQSGWGGTFHSIGARILRRDGRAVGLEPSFTIMDESDAEAFFSDVAKSSEKEFFRSKDNPKPKVLQSWLSYARNTRRTISSVVEERTTNSAKASEVLIHVAETYRKRKLESQVADYDDLLTLWLEVLEKDTEARNRYQRQFEHILVDEYQDTNSIQSAIIDTLAAEHQIMAVGDDAQCIYTWRGAQFENILHFPDRHPGTKIYKILSNYRSTQPILNLANDILRQQAISGSGYEKELRAIRKGSLKPRIVECADTVSQARFVINRACALCADEGLVPGDIAILYRAHYQALDLQLELSRQGIPFTITSGIRFFEQAHIRDLTAQLRLLSNPRDEPAFARVCELMPKIGPKTALKLHRILMEAFEKKKGAATVPDHPTLFDEKPDAPLQKPCAHPIELLSDASFMEKVPEAARESWKEFAETMAQALEMFGQNPDKPDKTVQILIDGWYGGHIRTVYDNWESRSDDLNALLDFAARYDSMEEMLAQLLLLSSEVSEKSLDDDPRDKLRLSTIHQAKGLEFPVVFLIGASDGSLPIKRAIDDGDVDEERRLFYVAVTRAENELYICTPKMQVQKGGGVFPLEPSRFIDEIDAKNYESTRPKTSNW